jgi:hypothetical protein
MLRKMMKLSLLLVLVFAWLFALEQCRDAPIRSNQSAAASQTEQFVGRYIHRGLRESSGLAVSRRHPGVYWTISDSGNPPALYATTRSGELIREYFLEGATNQDWEALALDDNGRLWIGDIGDNMRRRNERMIYVAPEPDPYKETEANVIARYRFRYPDGDFDAEGMFIVDGLPYIVSKEPFRAVLYRFERLTPEAVHILQRVGELNDAKFVTGADASPDGERLVVCTYNRLWLYEISPAEGLTLADRIALSMQTPPLMLKHQVGGEAVGFDGEDLILTNERGEIFLVSQSAILSAETSD